jgi:hypothetical protein
VPRLTPADEFFFHQLPEPFPNVATHHDHWRDSLFFVLHPRKGLGDTLILTLAHFPKREEMDSLQLGRIGDELVFAQHARPYHGDPHTMVAGPVSIDIVEPYRTVKLSVDGENAPFGLDVTFSARTREHGLRRGTMKAGHEIIWDQSHMIQSGTYSGTYTHGGTTYTVDDWWGQRDHSWGVRDHSRCPFWMWLAIQLPDGMLGVWHWEYANGARVFTDGCFAPAGDKDPIPVVDFRHELNWTGQDGRTVDYGRDGDDVRGLAGPVEFVLEGGTRIGVVAEGIWCARYGPYGGGQNQMVVRTDDGRTGIGVYEITGAHHHRYFPIARAENLPPG